MDQNNQNVLFENETSPASQVKKTVPAPRKDAQEAAPAEASVQESTEGKPQEEPKAAPKPKAKKKESDAPAESEPVPTDIHSQLLYIQQNLKVGKDNLNIQGGRNDTFAYRTLEDICALLKPILRKVGCTLLIPVVPQQFGDWVFMTATARLENAKGEFREVTNSAAVNLQGNGNKYPAQEALSSSTMARKAALSSMFLLDDTRPEQQERLVPPEMDSLPRPEHGDSHVPSATAVHHSVQQPAPGVTKVSVEVTPAVPQPAAPAPQPHAEVTKEVLVYDSPKYQKLGISAMNFKGTEEEFIKRLKTRYEVSDEVAAAFIADFYRGNVA